MDLDGLDPRESANSGLRALSEIKHHHNKHRQETAMVADCQDILLGIVREYQQSTMAIEVMVDILEGVFNPLGEVLQRVVDG